MKIIFESTLKPVPFIGPLITYKEHPTNYPEIGHDFDVFFRDQLIGIVEVKCREYSAEFFRRQGGFLAMRDKLEYLWEKDKAGIPGMYACKTLDGQIFGQLIGYLAENVSRWQVAPENVTSNTDHGKQDRTYQKGYIIPLDLFSRLA